jgi:hypothetical protein
VAENDQTKAVVDELNKILDEDGRVVHFKRIYGPFVPHWVRPLKWLRDMRFIAKKECEFGNTTSFYF